MIEIHFVMEPLQAFGMSKRGGRTLVEGSNNNISINLNTGMWEGWNDFGLNPLNATANFKNREIQVDGNIAKVRGQFNDFNHLMGNISGYYFTLPMLLNLRFADPPHIRETLCIINGNTHRWIVSGEFVKPTLATSQTIQENHCREAVERIALIEDDHRRRLFVATHYFYVACRVARCSANPGEFVPETILNFAKVLEVLFPPENGKGSRDTMRTKLIELEYSNEEIESKFLPAIALRNEIDVGHVALSDFDGIQLSVLGKYTEIAEVFFSELINRIYEKLKNGTFSLADYITEDISTKAAKTISRLEQSLRENGYFTWPSQ